MLLSVFPHSVVLPTIGPCVYSETFFFVIVVVSFVHSPVLPRVNTVAVHIVVQPGAHVHPTIWPDVLARAADLVFVPVTFIHAVVAPEVFPSPMLHPRIVSALITTAVLPHLSSLTML